MDREILDTYIISVSAYSSNQAAAKILGTVTVSILDVNDNTPTFLQVTRWLQNHLSSAFERKSYSIGKINVFDANSKEFHVNVLLDTYFIDDGKAKINIYCISITRITL